MIEMVRAPCKFQELACHVRVYVQSVKYAVGSETPVGGAGFVRTAVHSLGAFQLKETGDLHPYCGDRILPKR